MAAGLSISVRKTLTKWLWVVPLICIPFGGLVMPDPAESYHWLGWSWLWIVLSGLIAINSWLHSYLNSSLPWQESPQRRFFLQLILSLLISLILINLSYFLFHKVGLNRTPDQDQFYVMNVYSLIFLVPLVSAQVVSYLFAQWKKTTLLTEKLEQENIQTRLESLRSHLDPHFLFNSLNILSSLIDKSGDDAQDFLASFSDVYRYVLKNKGESLVPLKTELEFLESYLHMIQVRFKNQMEIKLEYGKDAGKWLIPPLALQMLVENAIKHNKASESQPLRLEVIQEADQMVVRNNIRLLTRKVESHGTGLGNLIGRYRYFTDRTVEVYADKQTFEVRLPLIQRTEE